jgi:prophage regulatory protein
MTPLARPASAAIQILRLPQVRARTGLCRTMIYQLEAEHQFPRRVKIGVWAVGWIEGEVQDWLTQRVERSRSVPNPFA